MKQRAARGRAAKPVSNERLVQYIALLTRQVACDLGAFGSHVNSSTRPGRDARRELLQAGRSLMNAKLTLERERAGYVADQYARLGLGRKPSALKIQLGGGAQRLDGWVNVDLPPADLALDVLWGLPFPKGSARFVFCAHLLEHLDYPRDALQLLVDLRRVLARGGVLRLVVPDVEQYLIAYARRDRRFFRDRAQTWPKGVDHPTPLEQVLSHAGANKAPYDVWAHKFGYDFETLRLLLRQAGFTRIERSSYMNSRHRELRVDTASHYARAHTRGTHYSLFVDARR
jgi:predicted SAM-dependent methyltransferase